ncbi:DUF5590 domain-containing protein [Halalkalibacillus halophilus]|uniref:cell wall elongation regulator TseB-like domain-containing protein n=1 Tax=Halalkalibacillus halophilus TaxID=392827 RepID=UPI000419C453|nr:DUF5590 domain-containing protein [Halalkalibacillus halophilus]
MNLRNIDLRKWTLITLFIAGVIGAMIIVLFSYIYYDIHAEKQDREMEHANFALEHSPIDTVEETYIFNGSNSYTVVEGYEGETLLYVFVPVEEDQELEPNQLDWISQEEGVSKEEVYSNWEGDCDNCTLLTLTPGKLNEQVIWELTYTNNDRYFFQTYRFSNGELYDSISFRK